MRAKIDHAAAILGAPVKYAAAPAVGSIPVVQPKAEAAALISEILKSEPATEALLLTQVATAAQVEEEAEIVTAHAKPVSRTVANGRAALQRAAERAAEAVSAKPRRAPSRFTNPAESLGLVALFLFGAGLAALASWTFVGGVGDAVDLTAATALAIPGLAAITLASFGFIRRPAPRRA
jgi:hypothetical protein